MIVPVDGDPGIYLGGGEGSRRGDKNRIRVGHCRDGIRQLRCLVPKYEKKSTNALRLRALEVRMLFRGRAEGRNPQPREESWRRHFAFRVFINSALRPAPNLSVAPRRIESPPKDALPASSSELHPDRAFLCPTGDPRSRCQSHDHPDENSPATPRRLRKPCT